MPSSPESPIALVVLDMAGTTIDDGGAVYDALRECVQAQGVPVADDLLQTWMGTDKREAITALLAAGGITADAALVEACYADFSARLERAYRQNPPSPLPGVTDALTTLQQRGVKVALTTGFARDVADPLIAAIGWTPGSAGSPVDAVVTVDDVAAGRPAPYMVFRAMERTGVQSVHHVAVAGDTHVDLGAGMNAGARIAAGVLTGALDAAALATHPHTHILDSVADLPRVLDQLSAE